MFLFILPILLSTAGIAKQNPPIKKDVPPAAQEEVVLGTAEAIPETADETLP